MAPFAPGVGLTETRDDDDAKLDTDSGETLTSERLRLRPILDFELCLRWLGRACGLTCCWTEVLDRWVGVLEIKDASSHPKGEARGADAMWGSQTLKYETEPHPAKSLEPSSTSRVQARNGTIDLERRIPTDKARIGWCK